MGSDFSNLISAYEQSSSPIKSSSQPKSSSESYIDLNSVRDVDQLDENGWKYANLKDRIETLGILGEGAGGSVSKCKLKNGSKIFALKVINTLNTDPEYQKQIFRELQFNRSFNPNISYDIMECLRMTKTLQFILLWSTWVGDRWMLFIKIC